MLRSEWVEGSGCIITSTNNTILAAIFIYSMCFDVLVIILNMYKLLGIGVGPPRIFGKSRLTKLIFADGLIYFLIACVISVFRSLALLKCRYSFFVNMTATIFLLLRLNPVMSVIFNIPAAVFSTVCRLFDEEYSTLTINIDCSLSRRTKADQVHTSRSRNIVSNNPDWFDSCSLDQCVAFVGCRMAS